MMYETNLTKRNRALENFWYVYQLYCLNTVDLYGAKGYLGVNQLPLHARIVANCEALIQAT